MRAVGVGICENRCFKFVLSVSSHFEFDFSLNMGQSQNIVHQVFGFLSGFGIGFSIVISVMLNWFGKSDTKIKS